MYLPSTDFIYYGLHEWKIQIDLKQVCGLEIPTITISSIARNLFSYFQSVFSIPLNSALVQSFGVGNMNPSPSFNMVQRLMIA